MSESGLMWIIVLHLFGDFPTFLLTLKNKRHLILWGSGVAVLIAFQIVFYQMRTENGFFMSRDEDALILLSTFFHICFAAIIATISLIKPKRNGKKL